MREGREGLSVFTLLLSHRKLTDKQMGSHHQTYFQRQLPGRVPAPRLADAKALHTSSHGTRSSGMGIRPGSDGQVLNTMKLALKYREIDVF